MDSNNLNNEQEQQQQEEDEEKMDENSVDDLGRESFTECPASASADDIVAHVLQMTWNVADGLSTIKEIQRDIPLAYFNVHDCRVHVSPIFGYENEILVDYFNKTKPKWRLRLQFLHHWNDQNHIALFLSRCDDCSELGAYWTAASDYRKTVDCSYDLEIVNSDGRSICRRESPIRRFTQSDSFGWSAFATYEQILKDNPGTDLLIRCTIKTLGKKSFMPLFNFGSSRSSASTATKSTTTLTKAHSDPTLNLISEEPAPANGRGRNDGNKPPRTKCRAASRLRIYKAISKLLKKHRHLRLPNKLVKISCQDKVLYAKAVPLAARSTRFLKFFRSRPTFLRTHESPSLRLTDDNKPNIIGSMINFLCKDTCLILESSTLQDKLELLKCAHRFGIEDLKQDLLNQLLSNLDVSTALQIVDTLQKLGILADRTQEPYKILTAYVLQNYQGIRNTPEFHQDRNKWRSILLEFLA